MSDSILDLIDGALRDWGTSEDAARFVPEPARTFAPQDDEGEWNVIDVYTRAGAIADGTLVPVPEDLAANAGFRVHVALTRAAWEDCVAWSDSDNDRKGTLQDETGRLWDVLWMASRRIAATRLCDRDSVAFWVYRVRRAGRGTAPHPVTLVARAGAGDDGEQVVTITGAGED